MINDYNRSHELDLIEFAERIIRYHSKSTDDINTFIYMRESIEELEEELLDIINAP